MRKLTVETSDELIKKLEEERTKRKTQSTSDTIITILREHYKMPKAQTISVRQETNNILQRIRNKRIVHYFLIVIYLFLMLSVAVNIADLQISIVNVNYSRVHTPTDYTFMQTYPPSIDGIGIQYKNETIYFQVHIHSDTIITENTPVNIEAEASEGNLYAENISAIGIGFFGANYISSEQTIFQPVNSSNI